MKTAERLIVSLDLEVDAALKLVKSIPFEVTYKIGMRLFTSQGPSIVKTIMQNNKVFLDMKFHDIPNTVADAAEEVANLGCTMFNIHASGGPTMIKTTKERLIKWSDKTGRRAPLLLAVTVLTSLDDVELDRIGLPQPAPELVARWTEMALESGCDGIVCSPQEISSLRTRFGKDFIAVTPGVRRATDVKGDQKRVATPISAIRDGSTFIVVGRPILEAQDRIETVSQFIKEIGDGERSLNNP